MSVILIISIIISLDEYASRKSDASNNIPNLFNLFNKGTENERT